MPEDAPKDLEEFYQRVEIREDEVYFAWDERMKELRKKVKSLRKPSKTKTWQTNHGPGIESYGFDLD